MCAINPKRQRHFILSVYTSLEMTEAEWAVLVMGKVLEVENDLNKDARLRWHVKEQCDGKLDGNME